MRREGLRLQVVYSPPPAALSISSKKLPRSSIPSASPSSPSPSSALLTTTPSSLLFKITLSKSSQSSPSLPPPPAPDDPVPDDSPSDPFRPPSPTAVAPPSTPPPSGDSTYRVGSKSTSLVQSSGAVLKGGWPGGGGKGAANVKGREGAGEGEGPLEAMGTISKPGGRGVVGRSRVEEVDRRGAMVR